MPSVSFRGEGVIVYRFPPPQKKGVKNHDILMVIDLSPFAKSKFTSKAPQLSEPTSPQSHLFLLFPPL